MKVRSKLLICATLIGTTIFFSPFSLDKFKYDISHFTYENITSSVKNILTNIEESINFKFKASETASNLKGFLTSFTNDIKPSVHLDVPVENQMPELNNGCEIVSLQMLAEYKTNSKFDKIEFAKLLPLDPTPMITSNYNGETDIISWGDPDQGFVGDVTGTEMGYIINPTPLCKNLKSKFPTITNLTGSTYDDLQSELSDGNPVVVWINKSFESVVSPEQWYVPNSNKVINADFDNHAILLTGYDSDYIYYNDPIGGLKLKVDKNTFISNFTYLGSKALTIR
ncbi:MAG: C39 family peptidase [Peptostreptococcaceae bacterium]